MARKKPADPMVRAARGRAGQAMDRAEHRLEDTAEALERVGRAPSESDRRRALVDVLEGLMDASYQLGVAEVELAQAGNRDPLRVPRFEQVVEQFTEIWQVAQSRRVANPSDRSLAAVSAGVTSAAGAVLGGLVGGPMGVILGSMAGGAVGPVAFLKTDRKNVVRDAALGGSVGSLFTPVGAAIGAYFAAEELNASQRAANPDADTMVDRINEALEDKDWGAFESAAEDLFGWIRQGGGPPGRLVDWRNLESAYNHGRIDREEYMWLLEINDRARLLVPLAERVSREDADYWRDREDKEEYREDWD